MSKAGERVVDKFSDLSQEWVECLIDFDQKQWVISVPFQEVCLLFGLVYRLEFCNTQFSGTSLVVQLLTHNIL